jgi:hypothetical protein
LLLLKLKKKGSKLVVTSTLQTKTNLDFVLALQVMPQLSRPILTLTMKGLSSLAKHNEVP